MRMGAKLPHPYAFLGLSLYLSLLLSILDLQAIEGKGVATFFPR